jgi:phosphoglucosamine mutase
MGEYFGTDGIRGEFGGAYINPDFAYRVGAALARYLLEEQPDVPLNVIIGRDTRASGQVLSDALTQGLNTQGVFVHNSGVVPTPAVALAVVQRRAALGITITASHNPAQDNGIKLFNSLGQKFDTEQEARIEALIDLEPIPTEPLPLPKSFEFDGASYYVNYVRSLMDQNCMAQWKVVLDTANGSTFESSPAVFKRWNAGIFVMGNHPDGTNINLGVGSEYPIALGRAVREQGAHIGIAHDGDGDRLVVCDENGNVVDGDVLLGIFGVYALRAGALSKKTLVTTIQSNLGLDLAIIEAGGKVERVDVGDRNVAQKMREIGANIGGENSGHLIFSDFATTGDGLLAAVKLIDLMCRLQKPLSELAKVVTLFPEKVLSLVVKEKKPLEQLDHLNAAIKAVKAEFGTEGRVLVRYSGTEPKLRLLVECKEAEAVNAAMKSLELAVRSDLDVIDG